MAVLIDSNIWASYFRTRTGAVRLRVDELTAAGLVRVIRLVVHEVTVGIRDVRASDGAKRRMERYGLTEMSADDWQAAINAYRLAVDASGTHLPTTDVLLAAVAARSDWAVWSDDRHFDLLERTSGIERSRL